MFVYYYRITDNNYSWDRIGSDEVSQESGELSVMNTTHIHSSRDKLSSGFSSVSSSRPVTFIGEVFQPLKGLPCINSRKC